MFIMYSLLIIKSHVNCTSPPLIKLSYVITFCSSGCLSGILHKGTNSGGEGKICNGRFRLEKYVWKNND